MVDMHDARTDLVPVGGGAVPDGGEPAVAVGPLASAPPEVWDT